MLHQPDDVVLAQLQDRRRQLLAEANASRLARRLRPPSPSVFNRLLATLAGR